MFTLDKIYMHLYVFVQKTKNTCAMVNEYHIYIKNMHVVCNNVHLNSFAVFSFSFEKEEKIHGNFDLMIQMGTNIFWRGGRAHTMYICF